MAVANEGGKNQSYYRYECPHYLLQGTDRKRLVLSKKSIGMDVCNVMCAAKQRSFGCQDCTKSNVGSTNPTFSFESTMKSRS